jgi:hypothetical protein
MNFDGKALVVNQHYDMFYSDNGSAIVMPASFITEFNQDIGNSNVAVESLVINKEESMSSSIVNNKLVPYTVQVYNKDTLYEYSTNLNSSEKIYITDNTSLKFEKTCNFESVKITDLLLSTNVFIKEVTAYITDITKTVTARSFPAVYANIVDKTEIVIPSVSTGYQDMSIVVQKNNFIELKFSDTIINVTGLPDGLEYTLGVIKGTITQSGSYDITIQYEDSSQKLNIIVPYYQRLL